MTRLVMLLSGLHPEIDFTEDLPLIDGGVLDSLDIVTLVTDINEEFGISIAAEDIVKDNFNTPRAIADLISRYGIDVECSL